MSQGHLQDGVTNLLLSTLDLRPQNAIDDTLKAYLALHLADAEMMCLLDLYLAVRMDGVALTRIHARHRPGEVAQ